MSDPAKLTPEGKRRARKVAARISVALVLIGLLGLVVALHELRLRDDPGRVVAVGAVLAAASLIVCWAGVMLGLFTFNVLGIKIQLWSGRLVLAACWLIAIGAISLGIAELRSLSVDFVILLLVGVVAAFAVYAFVFLHWLTGVSLGKVGVFLLGLVGTAFTIFQFWYEQEYIPAHKPPGLSLTAKLEPGGQRAGREFYTATVTVKNTGSVKVLAFTGTYLVSGVDYGPKRVGGGTEDEIMGPLKSPGVDPYVARFSRHYRQNQWTPIAAGKLFSDNRYFEPGDELSREYVVPAPRCRYPLLSLRTNVVVARGELLRLGEKQSRTWRYRHQPKPPRFVVWGEWHVEDNSWIHDIIDGPELWLQITDDHWPFGSDRGYFNPNAWLRSGDEDATVRTRREAHRLGLARTFADYELPIQPKDSSADTTTQTSQPNGSSKDNRTASGKPTDPPCREPDG